jgi:hypothetical protein
LFENLADAKAAIVFVRDVCGIKADNWDQPAFEGQGAKEGMVGKARHDGAKLHDELSTAMLMRYDSLHTGERLLANAKLLKSDQEWKECRDTIDALNEKKDTIPKSLIDTNKRLADENKLLRAQAEELKKNRERSMANRGDVIRQKALAATHHKAGNCEAQAAVAFMFLQQKGVHPIDYYFANGGDHQWLVIGRTKGSPEDNPDAWGPAAVICDAWDRKAYAATEFDAEMHALGQNGIPTSEFRIE